MNNRSESFTEQVGPTGVSAGSGDFDLEIEGSELRLAPGRCYVNGRVCVLDTGRTLFFGQPPSAPGAYLIYLNAWEEDPARDDPFFARRPALDQTHPYGDGLRTLWQARYLRILDDKGEPVPEPALVDPRGFESGWRPPEAARGRLQARASGDIVEDGVYRVEVHEPPNDDGELRFKSSSNDGATASRLLAYRQDGDAHHLELESNTDDYPRGEAFVPGKWVEVIQSLSSARTRSWLGTIVEVEPTTLGVAWVGASPPRDLVAADRVLVRQWDRVARATSNAVVGLEADGGLNTVEARFVLGGNETFEAGDFWEMPASSERNTILWPIEGEAEGGFVGPARRPDGIVHHYCPVGLVRLGESGWTGDVKSLLPELETITQVATEVNPTAPSDGRVPTERAVTTYVERVQREADELQLPQGVIVMWSGAEEAIPAGWALCDGKNGTPDLRSRFIVGAGAGGAPEYLAGASGEPDTHHHRVNVPSQSFETSSDGAHSHKMPEQWFQRRYRTGGTGVTRDGIDPHGGGDPSNDRSQEDGAHTHTVTVNPSPFDSGPSSAPENRPRWFALCFIMRA